MLKVIIGTEDGVEVFIVYNIVTKKEVARYGTYEEALQASWGK